MDNCDYFNCFRFRCYYAAFINALQSTITSNISTFFKFCYCWIIRIKLCHPFRFKLCHLFRSYCATFRSKLCQFQIWQQFDFGPSCAS